MVFPRSVRIPRKKMSKILWIASEGENGSTARTDGVIICVIADTYASRKTRLLISGLIYPSAIPWSTRVEKFDWSAFRPKLLDFLPYLRSMPLDVTDEGSADL